jgi:hypothetical protein
VRLEKLGASGIGIGTAEANVDDMCITWVSVAAGLR